MLYNLHILQIAKDCRWTNDETSCCMHSTSLQGGDFYMHISDEKQTFRLLYSAYLFVLFLVSVRLMAKSKIRPNMAFFTSLFETIQNENEEQKEDGV
ncbi:hypothetical protein OUZ56_007311 [Daphnia magna]|uniref:Uncharacterized protein n=1 Tax=Daphnia magna TaxID=35525 RepID=A0ABQ9YY88_9CRUS|nr:hypothetical protein OUZ56_007311 [Daphnia magna]